MEDREDEFNWVSEEDLRTASNDKLIERVMTLQQQVYAVENDLEELKELVYLLLDLETGLVEEFHPELRTLLERIEESDSSIEDVDLELE